MFPDSTYKCSPALSARELSKRAAGFGAYVDPGSIYIPFDRRSTIFAATTMRLCLPTAFPENFTHALRQEIFDSKQLSPTSQTLNP